MSRTGIVALAVVFSAGAAAAHDAGPEHRRSGFVGPVEFYAGPDDELLAPWPVVVEQRRPYIARGLVYNIPPEPDRIRRQDVVRARY